MQKLVLLRKYYFVHSITIFYILGVRSEHLKALMTPEKAKINMKATMPAILNAYIFKVLKYFCASTRS